MAVNPLVTIVYTTYNHEKFVKRAIESFLAQKADFDYEIIVQDDNSKDSTAELLRYYALKYPEIITPIFQSENQWSKGLYPAFYVPLCEAKGRYIAFCDGDDFWLSSDKLSKQVFAMRHFAVDMCGHPAEIISEQGEQIGRSAGMQVEFPTRLAATDLIKRNCNVLPKSSIMISSEIRNDLLRNIPPVRYHSGLQLMGARRSGLCILPEALSAYRINVQNSTTQILLGSTEKKATTAIKRLQSLNRIFELYDEKARLELYSSISDQFAYIFPVFGWQGSKDKLSLLTALSKTEKKYVLFKGIVKFVYLKFINIIRLTKRRIFPKFKTVNKFL